MNGKTKAELIEALKNSENILRDFRQLLEAELRSELQEKILCSSKDVGGL